MLYVAIAHRHASGDESAKGGIIAIMYAPSKIQERLELAALELGFVPEPHSPSEIDTFNAGLERKYRDYYAVSMAAAMKVKDQQKKFRETMVGYFCNRTDPRLSLEEVRFIQNERAMVMCDASYWLTRYYWISNRQAVHQRFQFQAGQRILFDCIAELEMMGGAVEILNAKARQLGVSTEAIGLIFPKLLFSHGVTGVTASADGKKTKEMIEKIFLAYDKLPWWLPPISTARSAGQQGYLAFGSINTRMSFEHGEQVNPIGMGNTLVGYLLSEVSSYTDAEDLIDVGLFKAVHPSPRVFGILESTCKGDTGWWHERYWKAKRLWPQRQSRLFALFLPFYCADDMYPNPTERMQFPVTSNWRPMDETSLMIRESEAYVDSNPVLARVLAKNGKQWRMSREQAFYWERGLKESLNPKTWLSEMPHTDKAAFQSSFDNVFGRELIAEVFTDRPTQYGAYVITGQSIEERHEPDEEDIDQEMVRVPIRWQGRRGEHFNWELVPVQWQEPFLELADIREENSHMGKCFVYMPPEPGYDYAVGIHTSRGLGDEPTAIAVARRGRHAQDCDIQVAEYRDDQVSHVEAFAWGAALAAYYGKFMSSEFNCPVRHRMPYVAIEQMMAVGDTCQLQMRKLGFSRFHRFIRYDSRPQDMRKSKSRKEGWFTTTWSGPMLTDSFVILVQNGWYRVNSPYTIWEMDHWEVHYTEGGKEKFEHSQDTTDKGLLANAMCCFCPNDLRSMADRTAKQYRESDMRKPPKLDMTPTTEGTVFSATGSQPLTSARRML